MIKNCAQKVQQQNIVVLQIAPPALLECMQTAKAVSNVDSVTPDFMLIRNDNGHANDVQLVKGQKRDNGEQRFVKVVALESSVEDVTGVRLVCFVRPAILMLLFVKIVPQVTTKIKATEQPV